MRERGLKRASAYTIESVAVAPHAGAWIETIKKERNGAQGIVAPHAGAWIETCVGPLDGLEASSLPMRGRGLKPAHVVVPGGPVSPVAPHAGAWIETSNLITKSFFAIVAPHAGAWIETWDWNYCNGCRWSLPMRERGLKQAIDGYVFLVISRSPCGSVD